MTPSEQLMLHTAAAMDLVIGKTPALPKARKERSPDGAKGTSYEFDLIAYYAIADYGDSDELPTIEITKLVLDIGNGDEHEIPLRSVTGRWLADLEYDISTEVAEQEAERRRDAGDSRWEQEKDRRMGL